MKAAKTPLVIEKLTTGLTPEEFGAAVRWHPETIRRCIRQGRVKALKLGRRFLIPRSELDRVMSGENTLSAA